mmetsp:Transcript_13538/g.17649  ORF Transcript_13538/g.17649 Transcript_13538/m.17649 type:complete len:238 (-) Transcript_13538:647-1360(-)
MGSCASIERGKEGTAADLEMVADNFEAKFGEYKIVQVETEIVNNLKVRKIKVEPRVFELKSLWKEAPVVLHLFRRFGCALCRNTALKISSMQPILNQNGVQLVGVGLSFSSLDGMLKGNYWKSNKLFVSEGAELHKALGLQNASWTQVISLLETNIEAKENGVVGEYRNLNNGRRLGALFVISKKGDMLYEWRQKRFVESPPKQEVYKALGISTGPVNNQSPKTNLAAEPDRPLSQS